MGISHLSLSRSIRTLSAGEYQALYLVSCLNSLQTGKEYFLFLDEPTKGLSQNIINQLMVVLRKLQDQFNITIVYIEHTPYMLRAADYVIDFGQERSDNVTSLPCISHEEWNDLSKTPQCNYPIVRSNYTHLSNMHTIDEPGKADQVFQRATNQFYSSIKEFSDTANGIYSSFDSDDNIPTIPIDFARTLYSSGTRLWEIGNAISHIVSFVSGTLFLTNSYTFENPFDEKCQKALRYIREAGGMYTHSTLLKRMHESREVFRQIIETLKDNGSITEDQADTGGKRPLVYYRLVQ